MNSSELLETDFGQNNPTGLYSKYADPGFSARLAYSKSFKKNSLLKWQAGIQYISFRSDYWTDEFTLNNTLNGPNVDINNYEQGYILNGGLRLTANNGISKNGNFRPYVGALVGFAFLSEKTSYDWGDGCSTIEYFLDIAFDGDYCINNNNTTDIEHRSTSPAFTLDIGTNIFFKENHKFGIDFGIRYNMLTRLKRPDTELLYDQTSNVFDQISRNIEADYYTWYLGVTIKLDENRKEKRRNKRGKGKLI